MAGQQGGSLNLSEVRSALRDALQRRGYAVSSDTLGRSDDLYIVGANDLARALFHFGEDAGDTAHAMYMGSGSWSATMPPRFAVLPASQASSPSIEMLEQMRAIPLFFELVPGYITFQDLDRLLAENLPE